MSRLNLNDLIYVYPRGSNRMRLTPDIFGLRLKHKYQKIFLENLLDISIPYEIPVRFNGEVVGKYKINTSSLYGFQAGQFYIDENIIPKSFLEYQTRSFSARCLPLSIKKEIDLNIADCKYKLSRDIILNIPKVNIYYEEKFKFDEDMKGDKKNVRKRSK